MPEGCGSAQEYPGYYSWDSPKVSGQTFNLLATEWNGFTARINEFRYYKGFPTYSYTVAVPGMDFGWYMFNEARNQINDMSAYFFRTPNMPATVASGDDVYASYLNDLVDCMNAIRVNPDDCSITCQVCTLCESCEGCVASCDISVGCGSCDICQFCEYCTDCQSCYGMG
jgi:hypothetical protein